MIRVGSCVIVLALAACPKKGTTSQPGAGAGCPTAAGVYIASYAPQQQGRSGWVVPLHAVPLQGQAADYTKIDAAAASAAGVPPAPTGTLWLVGPSGQACQAKLGSFYAAKIETSLSYGVEIEGCPAPKNPEEGGGIVLVSEQAPSGCRFELPQPIAARLGETDQAKKWQRPAKESPLPQALADAIPQKPCDAPACEKLWAFAEVKVNGQTVAWTGAYNWLRIDNEPDQCAWKAERESGFWIPAAQGGAAVKVTEGQEHSLPLAAVLADGTGAKVALAEANGQYATYDLAPGRATLGHRVVYMHAPPQAWDAVDNLGPICDEDRD